MQKHTLQASFVKCFVEFKVSIFIVTHNHMPVTGQVHADLDKADFVIKLPIKACNDKFVCEGCAKVVIYEHNDAFYSAK